MAAFGNLKHAWNAFLSQPFSDPVRSAGYGISYGVRPDRLRFTVANERSIIASIYTRVSIDVAGTEIKHVRLDEEDRYIEEIDSGLNNCLTVEANIDQAARAFRQNIAETLCNEGCAAIVPVDTTLDPSVSGSFDIRTLRVATIVEWYPKHVRVSLYNETKGFREEITLEKKYVAIVENPLYNVMNEPNSTLQRLIRKLGILDAVDEQSGSGKLDIIIQLPYVIKSDARKQQAEQRRKDIEFQLKGSKYGIAYTDGTEKITQLNRPAENNLLEQVKYLKEELYSELGLTKEVIDGTANEAAMLNYQVRTVEPLVDAIVEAMRRAFLTKTARSQRQTILYFRNPFKLVPISQIADVADKFTRNEILAANEIRGIIGFKPHKDPKADQLVNSNINPTGSTGAEPAAPAATADETDKIMNDAFDSLDSSLDGLLNDLGAPADA